MYSLFSIGVAGWIIYGFMIASLPIILANVVTFLLACAVLVLKLKHR
jgi:MtN3 and saliva related transmembrane protein